MRLKYYLRGLGLGIIFAVIIMMIGFHGNKQSMSDTEIICLLYTSDAADE